MNWFFWGGFFKKSLILPADEKKDSEKDIQRVEMVLPADEKKIDCEKDIQRVEMVWPVDEKKKDCDAGQN